MNVSEIRQRIFDQMDYFPDLQQYRDSVVRRMNDRYQELCDSAHWLFLQKEREITIRKEVTGDSGDTSTSITVQTSNLRKLTCAFTVTQEMEGQTLTNTTTSKEFRIVRVLISGANNFIYIDDDWDGTTGTAVYNHKITFQRFALPEDCIEVMGFIDRDDDRGKLLYVDRRREEFAYLDADNTGDPSTVIEDEHIIDDPPFNNPTASTSTNPNTSNTPVNGVTYEYKYTIYREGRESPPSLPVQVTIPSSGFNRVTLSNLDDTGFYATQSATSTTDSGLYKHIYRRDVTNDGKWMLVGTASSTATSFINDELLPIAEFEFEINSAFRYSNTTDVLRWKDPGPRQNIRFYYTPSEDKNIHIRYHFRPNDLVADNDVPTLPRQYHMILVYMTLQEMFLQMQDTVQSQLFERRAELMKIQLRRRFLTRDDVRKKFERWDRRHGGRNRGVPSLVHLFPNFPSS